MSHPLTINTIGAGTPSVVRMINGVSQDTANGLGTLPGASVDDTGTGSKTRRATANRVLKMGHRIFAAVGDDVWQRDGSGAFVAQGLALSVNASPLYRARRAGLTDFMHPTNGPGWVTFYTNAAGNMAALTYDFLTDAYTETDLGTAGNLGLWTNARHMFAVGVEVFASTTQGVFIYNVVTGVIQKITSPGHRVSICPANGTVYALGPDDSNNDTDLSIWAILGGVFVKIVDLPGTASDGPSSGGHAEVSGHAIYEKDGFLYAIGPNDNVAVNNFLHNGWRMFKHDIVLGTTTEVTLTEFNAILAPDGGLSSNNARRWIAAPWKVLESPFGAERVFIQLFLGSDNDGSIVFEHATTWSLVQSSQWTGYFAPVVNHTGGSQYFWTSGELTVVLTGPPAPVAGGVKFDFRVYGDAGTADKVVRAYFDSDPNAPHTLASQIAAPGSGTGGVSVISGAALTNVNADGESGSPTTYSIVHKTIAEGIPGSAPVNWFFEANTA